jgi:predicted phosphodiesterase
LVDRLEAFKPLRGVWGNIDEPSLRRRFPEHQVFSCEGLKVWMTHIGGYPGKYPKKIVQGLLEHQPGLFICGHSHILKVIPDPQYQLLHINPGAFGLEGWHKSKTCLRFEVMQGRVQGLELLEKPKRLEA